MRRCVVLRHQAGERWLRSVDNGMRLLGSWAVVATAVTAAAKAEVTALCLDAHCDCSTSFLFSSILTLLSSVVT